MDKSTIESQLLEHNNLFTISYYSQMLCDLCELSKEDFIDKHYHCGREDYEYLFEDGILNIPFVDKIADLIPDKELTFPYYLNYGGEDSYGDAIEFLENNKNLHLGDDGYMCTEVINTINTYNYESYLSRVLQFSYCYDEKDDKYIVALQVHDGKSDVRCNYSPIVFYVTDDMESFLLGLESCMISIDNSCINIYVNCDESNIYNDKFDCDVYLETYKVLECLEILEETCKINVYG